MYNQSVDETADRVMTRAICVSAEGQGHWYASVDPRRAGVSMNPKSADGASPEQACESLREVVRQAVLRQRASDESRW